MINVIHKALTIAGLDSGGGAGIIADLKTFSALKVWGMAALTSVTAQNTKTILGVQDISTEMIKLQIEAVAGDIGVDAAKTGMLHTSSIIEIVAETVSSYGFPLIVDPVMIAKSGAPLIKESAIESLKKKILPIAKVVTPNIPEAEKLSGIKINNFEDMKKAAKHIAENFGCESVVVKGGHLGDKESVDVLYWEGDFFFFKSSRIFTKNTHGTGCTYSAAITAEIAKGKKIVDAIRVAKEFIHIAILYGLDLGSGHGPVNHMAWLYREAEKYTVIRELRKILRMIESKNSVVNLIPEVGMNIAFAVEHAVDKEDVAAIPGRIRNAMGVPKACCDPDFGASKHLASYILTARKYNKKVRAAINIKYDPKIIEKLEKMGLIVSFFDRTKEPEEVKIVEGRSIPWGTEEAIKRIGKVPDVIYHKGDLGKEPMIVILAESPQKIIKIIRKLTE